MTTLHAGFFGCITDRRVDRRTGLRRWRVLFPEHRCAVSRVWLDGEPLNVHAERPSVAACVWADRRELERELLLVEPMED